MTPSRAAQEESTSPRVTAHTFEQVNWEYAEQETRIGVLQEMVAILLNRLDGREAAAATPSLDGMAANSEFLRYAADRIKDIEGRWRGSFPSWTNHDLAAFSDVLRAAENLARLDEGSATPEQKR